MATRNRPKSGPLTRRMVNISSSAWVGWACRPSPALMTLTCGATLLRDEVRRPAVGMPDHEHVDVHGLQVAQRVQQGFALDRAGLGDVDVEHVGRQAFRGQLECGPCASAGLEKEVDDSLAAQQRDLLDGLFGNAGKGFCGIEDLGEQIAGSAR